MSISFFATRRTEGGENRTPPKEAQLTNDTGNTNSAANKDIPYRYTAAVTPAANSRSNRTIHTENWSNE